MTILTLRLIRNFDYRTFKYLVLRDVDLDWTTEKLIEETQKGKLM